MAIIKSLQVEIAKNFKPIEVDITELYYLDNMNVAQISKHFKIDRKQVIEVLTDPYYRPLRKPFEDFRKGIRNNG